MLSTEPYAETLRKIGFGVRWYQCIDRGRSSFIPEGGVAVPGLGVPLESLEMGMNRFWVFPRRLRKITEDVLFLSDPTLSFAARFHPETVALVHDLTPLTAYSDRWDARWMFKAVVPRLREMSLVIVTTRTTRSELEQRGVSPNRIRVVPYTHTLGFHAGHPKQSVDRIARTGVLRLLYVATDRPFKNIEFVLRLAKALETAPVKWRFVVTLVSDPRPVTRRQIAELGLTNLQVRSNVPSIASLYEESDVLVYPSLHEGFGRPLIESMAYGIPILANRIQPLIDIVGDAGVLLGVDSVDPWVDVLTSLTDPSDYAALAQKSLDRAPAYSPERFDAAVRETFQEFLPRYPP